MSEGNDEKFINTLKQAFINEGYTNTLFDTLLRNYKSERCLDHNRNNLQFQPPNVVARMRAQTVTSQNVEGEISQILAESKKSLQ